MSDQEAGSHKKVETLEHLPSPRPSRSGPSIPQVFVWGFFAAAIGSLLAWIGSMLSEDPGTPVAVDSLHGLDTPTAMNEYINALLESGQTALNHDVALINTLGFAVAGVCLLCAVAAGWFIVRSKRTPQEASTGMMWVVAIALTAVPIGVGGALKLMQEGLLQTTPVVEAMTNENTRPPLVDVGSRVGVQLPVELQSFLGFYETISFKLEEAIATRADGGKQPIELGTPELPDGGREPGATDIVPVMLNLNPRLNVMLPPDQDLAGGLVGLTVSGSLRIIPGSQRSVRATRDFQSSATFRIARENELEFANRAELLPARLTLYLKVTLAVAAAIAVALLSLTARKTSNAQTIAAGTAT